MPGCIRKGPYIFLFVLLAICSCKSRQKFPQSSSDTKPKISFGEFKKILSPKGSIFPLAGGKKSYILLSLPDDSYSKIYTLDHDTGKFTVKFDFGRNITSLTRDYTYKNYYFLADDLGNERYSIYSWDPSKNKATLFYGSPQKSAAIGDFSRDGKRLYILSNHANDRIFSPYVVDRETKEIRALTDGSLGFNSIFTDRSERFAALKRSLGNNEVETWLLDLKNGNLEKLLSDKGTRYAPTFFNPAGTELYVTTDASSDRMKCAKIATSAPYKLVTVMADDSKDIYCYYKEKSDTTTVYESYNGRSTLKLFKGVFGAGIGVSFPDRSVVGDFTKIPDSNNAVIFINSSNAPGEYYEFDASGRTGTPMRKICDFNLSDIRPGDFATSYDLFFEGYGKLNIHGLIFAKKEWMDSKARHPAIVWIHGGPDDFVPHVFHPFIQYAVLNGYVVFAPNYRGSTGYGKRFETLNDRDWGGADLEDLILGTKTFSRFPYVDSDRVFVVGASFGSFLALSAMTDYPTQYTGAVVIMPISNLFTFMYNLPGDSGRVTEFLKELGDPNKNENFYLDRSPYFKLQHIQRPLKIFQPEMDIRVTKKDADELAARLTSLKIPFEYDILEADGHRLDRKESWEKVFEGTIEFFNRFR